MTRPRRSRGRAHRREERAHVLDEQLRLFERGEVPAARHVRPVGDVVDRLAPAARRLQQFSGESRDAGGQFDAITAAARPLKLSQYRRAEDAAVPVTQYTITLSSSSSRLSTFSGCPSQSVHAQNFSTIHASCPTGESTSP